MQKEDILWSQDCQQIFNKKQFAITSTFIFKAMSLSSVQTTEPNPSLPPPSCSLPFFLLSCSPPFFLVSPSLSSPVSKVYKRVLVLDEVVQCTEEDEWAYHEMAAHIPLFSHPNPRSVSGVHATTLELLHSSLCSSHSPYSL